MRVKPLTVILAACVAAGAVFFVATDDGVGHRSSPSMEIVRSSICNGNTGTFTVKVHHLPLQGEGNYTLNISKGDHNPNTILDYTGMVNVDRSGDASSEKFSCPRYLGTYTATVTQGGREVVSAVIGVPKN